MDKLFRSVQEKATRAADNQLSFIASTNSVDRYESIVEQDWNDAAFRANPVFLWMHQHNLPPVGRVVDWSPEVGMTRATVDFAPTPMGRELFALYDGDYLRAVSVSFYPGEVSTSDSGVIVYSKNEMLELSGVTVPGNAEALKYARSAGLTEYTDGMVRAWFGLNEKDDVELAVAGAGVEEIGALRAMYETQNKRIEELEKLLLARSSEALPRPQILRIKL
jgi:hypothetical protein